MLTHCNTGPLATAGGGTALGVIIGAQRSGKKPRVFVDETRPLLQGARLNYLELRDAGVDAVLIVDSAAALTMKEQSVDLVIVGADRIARNGDTANKIGTYALAILAAHHGMPFYVAAPRSTFDLSAPKRRGDSDRRAGCRRSGLVREHARCSRRCGRVQPGLRHYAGPSHHRVRYRVRRHPSALRRVDSRSRTPAEALFVILSLSKDEIL